MPSNFVQLKSSKNAKKKYKRANKKNSMKKVTQITGI